MKIAMFSARSYDMDYFKPHITEPFIFHFFDSQLNLKTVKLTAGFDAVCSICK